MFWCIMTYVVVAVVVIGTTVTINFISDSQAFSSRGPYLLFPVLKRATMLSKSKI